MNVGGVNLKNIGSYLKSSLVKNLTGGSVGNSSSNPSETIKSINLKTSASTASAYYTHRHSASAAPSNANIIIDSNHNSNHHHSTHRTAQRQSTNLTHRQSNPLSSYTNTNVLGSAGGNHQPSSKSRMQAANSVNDPPTANALPRIRINS
jgi:hypothetical protein